MKKLQILGTGCTKCQQLTEAAEAAAKDLGIPYELEKVMELDQIMSYGVMLTPAFAVDGEVKLSGKVPTVEEAKALIQ